jgi:hypothetical protein
MLADHFWGPFFLENPVRECGAGLIILFAAQVGLMAYRRYPGPLG